MHLLEDWVLQDAMAKPMFTLMTWLQLIKEATIFCRIEHATGLLGSAMVSENSILLDQNSATYPAILTINSTNCDSKMTGSQHLQKGRSSWVFPVRSSYYLPLVFKGKKSQ